MQAIQSVDSILLASHGTDGAKAAESMAMQLCNKGGHIHHLIVVPTLWQGMTGDDWLNNGVTRDRFRRYLEDQLSAEVREHQARVNQAAEDNDINYTTEVVIGEPDECLLRISRDKKFDLVVMGSPRPKGKTGLRSRMVTKSMRNLSVPFLLAPYPDE